VIFSSNIIKPPNPQETEHRQKSKKEKEKKTPRIYSNKRGSEYFERRKTLQLQISFLM
jgi:hypothetical protein